MAGSIDEGFVEREEEHCGGLSALRLRNHRPPSPTTNLSPTHFRLRSNRSPEREEVDYRRKEKPTRSFRISEEGWVFYDQFLVERERMGVESSEKSVVEQFQALTVVNHPEFRAMLSRLLTGVRSWLFPFNERRGFYIRSNCTVTGLSPEAFAEAMQPMLSVGENFKNVLLDLDTTPTAFKIQKEAFRFAANRALVQLSQEISDICSENNGFHRLLLLLEPYLEIIRCLSELVSNVFHSEVLSPLMLVYSAAEAIVVDGSLKNVFLFLLDTCLQSFERCLRHWLTNGAVLSKSKGDFFVVENAEFSADRGRDFWKKGWTLKQDLIPGFWDAKTGKEILLCGKSSQLLRICGTWSGPIVDVARRIEGVQHLNDVMPEDTAESLQLPRLIKNGISSRFDPREPLSLQVDQILGSILLENVNFSVKAGELLWEKVSFHVETMRRIFLCQDSQFASKFTDALFPLLSREVTAGQLSVIIDAAIQELLITDAEWSPPSLLVDMKALEKKEDCLHFSWLEIDYRVPWPANIIVTRSMLNCYNRVFRLFLRLRWVQWCLMDVLDWISENTHDLKPTGDLHKLYLLRREMQHFVHFIQEYISNQVIEASWGDFAKEVEALRREKTLTVDSLYAAHNRYLGEILIRCALNEKAERLSKTLDDLLETIHQFRTSLRKCRPLFGELDSVYAAYTRFHHLSKYFFRVLDILSSRGYEGGRFEDLLLRLNFNHFYSAL